MGSSKKTTTTQSTSPYPAAQGGINQALGLATEGLGSASPYVGRFNPQTSSYSQAGVTGLKSLADSIPQGYGRSALDAGDYIWNKVIGGGFRPGTYDPAAAIESSVRPVVEKYSENLIPNLGAFFTNSGGYQGGAQGGVSNTAGDTLARNFNREAIQVGGEQALAAADLNSRNLLQGNAAELNAIGGLPAVFAGGMEASTLLPGLFAQAGAGEEGLAARDIIEALQQNQYGNMYEAGIAGPYLDLLMGPAEAFGTTTNTSKTKGDPITQAIQALGAIGSLFGGSFSMGDPLGGSGPANISGQPETRYRSTAPVNRLSPIGQNVPAASLSSWRNPFQPVYA